jgi:hypothetical protein
MVMAQSSSITLAESAEVCKSGIGLSENSRRFISERAIGKLLNAINFEIR